ncbi:tyrosine aminotransferase-like [Rhynchophorus ferrugineus]|uniref:tyrosine aminotransferase-like n=1 Tax=Rhynchophorus ferrugineus TaxID=354439 RepID=UPI003FCE4BFD
MVRENGEKADSLSVEGNTAEEGWNIEPSTAAKKCRNYVRQIVENMECKPNPKKPFINLSLGDPAVFGNLNPCKEIIDSLVEVINGGSYNGYTAVVGHQSGRQAVAEHLSSDGVKFAHEDVILCNGCTNALDICITVLTDATKGHNLLIPRPEFPIYRTIAGTLGVNVRSYNLIPEKKWEVDLEHLKSQIDKNTKAIIVNNPLNPAGSNYSREHLMDILEIARVHRIPIIADEIYGGLVFPGKKFVPIASLGSDVPILICGGLGKQFLVPGWRMGWVAIYDKLNVMRNLRPFLTCLCQKSLGSNTLIQGALPQIFKRTPQSFYQGVTEKLSHQAMFAFDKLSKIKGLTAYLPEATLYMVIQFDMKHFPFKDDIDLIKRLMEEESIFCLPGECFGIPSFARIVITPPIEVIEEACKRINQFCNRYYVE